MTDHAQVAFGALSERLLKLSAATNLPQPYQVTDTLVITPPTMKRGTEMRSAHMSMLVAQTLLAEAMRRGNDPRPRPEDFPDTAAHDAAVAQWSADGDANEKAMNDLAAQVRDAEDAYNRAFFGEAFDDVMAFFESQPQALWDAFVTDIKDEFLPSQPRDGLCPTCGHITDEEQAGKASPPLT
jgi:hypothetical protein